MRFVANKRRLPRSLPKRIRSIGVVAEADLFPLRYGRLAAKLFVFKDPKSLRRFWKEVMGHDLGRKCLGAVNAMSTERTTFSKGHPDVTTLHGDARYFCFIGLAMGHLTTEIIAHEAVHAGYAYMKRVRRNMWGKVGDFDEEQVAYPTGTIAGQINQFLHRKKLYR